MRILITGGSGQLGAEFILYLSQIQDITLFYPTHKELDITNIKSVWYYLKHNKVDIIINCAAYTAVDKAELDQDTCYAVNTLGVKNLVSICKQLNIILAQISSDYVYDGKSSTIYTEDSPKSPLSVYGKSKAAAEDFILANLTQYFIIRTSWLFGTTSNTNFVATMLKLLATNKQLSIVNDEIGSPTYTRDLVRAIWALLQTNNFGIYNIHNIGNISRYAFVKEIASLIQSQTELLAVSTEEYRSQSSKVIAPRPANSNLAINKISTYYTMPSWQEALKAYLIELKVK